MNNRICGRCKQEKPIAEFYKGKRTQTWCKACKLEYQKEYIKRPGVRKRFKDYRDGYYNRPEVKERIKEYVKECEKHPEYKLKRVARNYLRYRVRQGEIIKEPCVMCEQPQAEAHHPDYNQPLIVVWLCPSCHRELHHLAEAFKEAKK